MWLPFTLNKWKVHTHTHPDKPPREFNLYAAMCDWVGGMLGPKRDHNTWVDPFFKNPKIFPHTIAT